MVDNSWQFSSSMDIVYLFCCLGCVTCAALAAGMTLGLLSLDQLKLQIKLATGTEEEKRAANKILPLLANHHLLLCTLLLFNALANESLPIFLDSLVPSWAAVVIAVTLVLICGEIIPSAIFTGPNQLQMASRFAGLVYVLEIIFYPIACPMGLLLDHILGHEEDDNFNRDEISAMVNILRTNGVKQYQHYLEDIESNSKENRSGGNHDASHHISAQVAKANATLSENEVNVITGVLGLAKKQIRDVCIPMSKVNMLSSDQLMDKETITTLERVKHSRLPVFQGSDTTIILGFFLVKRLINVNPDSAISVMSVPLSEPVVVGASQSLLDVLNIFQSGHSHMALVSEAPAALEASIKKKIAPSDRCAPIGIVTIEDIFEAMLQTQIYDEEDLHQSLYRESASHQLREMSMRSSMRLSQMQILEEGSILEAYANQRIQRLSRSSSSDPSSPNNTFNTLHSSGGGGGGMGGKDVVKSYRAGSADTAGGSSVTSGLKTRLISADSPGLGTGNPFSVSSPSQSKGLMSTMVTKYKRNNSQQQLA